MNSFWLGAKPNPLDAVLLTKEWESSQRLSQQPLLLLPADVANKLDPAQLELSVCHVIKAQECKEYEKTAQYISQSPWNLHRAAAWLREFISGESMKPSRKPEFVFRGHSKPLVAPVAPTPPGWNQLAPHDAMAPRAIDIVVKKTSGKKTGKRKLAQLGLPAEDNVGEESVHAGGSASWSCGRCEKPDGCIECWRVAWGAVIELKGIEDPEELKLGCSKCVYQKRGCATCIKRNVLKAKGIGRQATAKAKGKGKRKTPA